MDETIMYEEQGGKRAHPRGPRSVAWRRTDRNLERGGGEADGMLHQKRRAGLWTRNDQRDY